MRRHSRLLFNSAFVACAIASWIPSTSSAQEAAATARDEEARRRFEAGETAFAAGEFAAALALFQSAYERSPRPGLLYNMGHCADRLRRDDDAIRWFERYLAESDPNAAQRGEAAARLRALREAHVVQATPPQATEPEPTVAPLERNQTPVTPPPSDSGHDVTSEVWFWALVIGAGAAAVGVTVAVVAVEAQPRPDPGSLGGVLTALEVRW